MQLTLEIFMTLVRIIMHPDLFWQDLDARTEQTDEQDPTIVNEMQQRFYYPLMGGAALILFFACGFRGKDFSLEMAMRGGVSLLLTYFAGLYLASFLICELFTRFTELTFDRRKLQCFVAYTASFALVTETIIGCLPSLKFFMISEVYMFYIAWCGASQFLHVSEERRSVFTFVSSLIILASPIIVGSILHFLER